MTTEHRRGEAEEGKLVRPAGPPHIAPDSGEIGVLPSRQHWAIRTFGSLACSGLSFLIFVLMMCGAPASATSNNILAGLMLGLWLAGNVLRRVLPLLWAEPGKLTYVRVMSVTCTRAPATVHSLHAAVSLLLDAVVLPPAIALATFHRVRVLSFVGIALYPPASESIAPMIVLFPLFGVLGLFALVLAYALVLPLNRMDPYRFESGARLEWLPKAAVVAAAAATLPLLTWSCAVMPCSGESLRFAAGVRCQGTGHHVLILFAIFFTFASGCLSEMSTHHVMLLCDPGAVPSHLEPRNDALFLELRVTLRWVAIIVATLSTHGAALAIVAFASGALLVYVWSGRSRCLASSVAILNDLYLLFLIQLTATSSVVCLLACVGLTNGLGAIIWLILWLLSLGGCGYVLVQNHGIVFFSSDSADVCVSAAL